MKVLACGTRSCPPSLQRVLEARLRRLAGLLTRETLFVVHGAATGVDAYAAAWAKGMPVWVEEIPHPADWDSRGRAAGPERNQRMLDEHPDIRLVLAFHADWQLGKGTRDMVQRARAKGLPVEIHLR